MTLLLGTTHRNSHQQNHTTPHNPHVKTVNIRCVPWVIPDNPRRFSTALTFRLATATPNSTRHGSDSRPTTTKTNRPRPQQARE